MENRLVTFLETYLTAKNKREPEGVVAQWCNPLTLKSERSG